MTTTDAQQIAHFLFHTPDGSAWVANCWPVSDGSAVQSILHADADLCTESFASGDGYETYIRPFGLEKKPAVGVHPEIANALASLIKFDRFRATHYSADKAEISKQCLLMNADFASEVTLKSRHQLLKRLTKSLLFRNCWQKTFFDELQHELESGNDQNHAAVSECLKMLHDHYWKRGE